MKNYLTLFLISLSLLIISACSSEETEGTESSNEASEYPDYVNILGASDGGTFYLLASGMANLFNNEMSEGQYSSQSTAGTNAIFQTLDAGDGEIGFGQASMAYDAVNGEGYFEDDGLDNMLGMTYMYPNVMHVVVREATDIETPEDLEGKRVGVGEAGGGVEVDSNRLFEALGLDMDTDISAEHVTGAQGSDMLRNNQLDALIMPGGLGASNTLEILSSDDYKLISFSDELVDDLIDLNPAYFPFEIPADTYPNQTEDIDVYAEANWLYARADLSEDFIYEVLTVLYDNQDHMIEVHNSIENMTLENSQNGNRVPLHPGAERFFEENGVETE